MKCWGVLKVRVCNTSLCRQAARMLPGHARSRHLPHSKITGTLSGRQNPRRAGYEGRQQAEADAESQPWPKHY